MKKSITQNILIPASDWFTGMEARNPWPESQFGDGHQPDIMGWEKFFTDMDKTTKNLCGAADSKNDNYSIKHYHSCNLNTQ